MAAGLQRGAKPLDIGGASVGFPQVQGYLYREGAMLSPDGRCRPFDARAAGTVFGDGVGAVVLERLEDALADGSRVLAVIRGAALSNDGNEKASFSAPSVAGQVEAIEKAFAQTDIDPRSIGYIEAHGTATPLGDPIEVAALTRAFRKKTEDRRFCGLGSVKGNVGHLDAASGIAGLIKAALALDREEIPATLHLERENPDLRLEESPFPQDGGRLGRGLTLPLTQRLKPSSATHTPRSPNR